VRDVEPIYYKCDVTDYDNRAPDIHPGASDRVCWFFSLDCTGRQHYSGDAETRPSEIGDIGAAVGRSGTGPSRHTLELMPSMRYSPSRQRRRRSSGGHDVRRC
jgi:hypothetical protein